MVSISRWQGLYQVLPDGRSRITRRKLMEVPRDRIVLARLKDRPGKALLLDKPFQLGPRVQESGVTGYYLLRIRIRDLEGWPPRISRDAALPRFPGALRCALRSVKLVDQEKGCSGGQCVEYELECQGDLYKAWQGDCPAPILRCVEATLRQEGSIGQKLADLQEMRLIGTE